MDDQYIDSLNIFLQPTEYNVRSFNDPPTADYWSKMSSTSAGRKSFAKNVLAFIVLYGFDGIDLDWEYPGASDRGGDTTLWTDSYNYIFLIEEIRTVFDATGRTYTISVTTPASYWYLQTFQVNDMLLAGADWTMMMTYDLHGVWDGTDPYVGKVLGSHTNLTEIKIGLDLLWRTNVDPSQVVMGMGFYGRSFTMSDVSCQEPGCPFASAGNPGDCTATGGILSYKGMSSHCWILLNFHLFDRNHRDCRCWRRDTCMERGSSCQLFDFCG